MAADSGIFERRNQTESRLVLAAAVVLCVLGWASSLYPVVAGSVAGVLLAVAGLVALRRHLAVRARIERDLGAQSAAGWGPWGDVEPGDVLAPPPGDGDTWDEGLGAA